MSPELAERIERVLGKRPTAWQACTSGYTPALRGIVTLADGSTAFIKVATTDNTIRWLRQEWQVYTALGTQPFLAEVRGWNDDGAYPLLALEDLSAAHWGPPWLPGQVESVLAALAQIRRAPQPANLPTLESQRADICCWQTVADERSRPGDGAPGCRPVRRRACRVLGGTGAFPATFVAGF